MGKKGGLSVVAVDWVAEAEGKAGGKCIKIQYYHIVRLTERPDREEGKWHRIRQREEAGRIGVSGCRGRRCSSESG